MRTLATPLVAAGLLMAAACSEPKPSPPAKAKSKAAKPAATPAPLVVYSGRSEALVGPVLKRFDEANPDLTLDVRYNKTPALAAQILAEAEACPADLIWFQDSGYLSSFDAQLAALPAEITGRVDPRFRAVDGKWVGVTGRLRVLVYNTEALKPAAMPASLKALAEPKWKGKLGWAPGNASFQAHISALRVLWGEDSTRDWLKAVKANAPANYPKNSPQVLAASTGEIQVGWVNHYYLHKLGDKAPKAANWSFPADADAGNLLMLAGLGIRAKAKNEAGATRLAKFLLSDETQSYFAKEAFEYPTVPDIATHPDVTPMEQLKLVHVEQKHLADVEGTLALLKDVGLD